MTSKSTPIVKVENWGSLEKAIRVAQLVIKAARRFRKQSQIDKKAIAKKQEAINLIVRKVQQDIFQSEIETLKKKNLGTNLRDLSISIHFLMKMES